MSTASGRERQSVVQYVRTNIYAAQGTDGNVGKQIDMLGKLPLQPIFFLSESAATEKSCKKDRVGSIEYISYGNQHGRRLI
jgi:hypothetical protein